MFNKEEKLCLYLSIEYIIDVITTKIMSFMYNIFGLFLDLITILHVFKLMIRL